LTTNCPRNPRQARADPTLEGLVCDGTETDAGAP
jgi:hypothetical protein